ncbi:magnesium/cobalt transporter CorA [Mangrovitalea sediminis]|uniref:magnesium/cobalt transporter CorA n=1 Tax=Mangrovitalea sediminis TaxID=1982043 RepID=UPI000BE4BD4E|nr:magnesium/cobalt transporter CorA [Mangrovitalea sediminis]
MAYFGKSYHPPGTAPGTLSVPAETAHQPLSIRLIDYTDETFEERELVSVADCCRFLGRESRTWIQVNGTPDPEMLKSLGAQFQLHDLALEDVLNTGQRPKVDTFGDQLFVIMTLPVYRDRIVRTQQMSFFVGDNYIICFCPSDTDPFEPVRRRLRLSGSGRLRSRGVDYLLYALLDLVIDEAFPVLEAFGDEIEDLEEELLVKPDQGTLSWIHGVKRELLLLRRMLWPQREVINALLRLEDSVIHEDTHVYLRDCYDHCIQIMDLLESFRDMATSMLDVYLSSISNRTNDIMRVLTIIATIFIPLTFIVGVYGMNFSNDKSPWAMPELHWYYGYPLVWGLMLLITAGLLWYFRRQRWI